MRCSRLYSQSGIADGDMWAEPIAVLRSVNLGSYGKLGMEYKLTLIIHILDVDIDMPSAVDWSEVER